MRKALIEQSTGRVTNIIELEDGATWRPPFGQSIRDAENASPGDTWDGIRFVPPPAASSTDWKALWLAAVSSGKIEQQIKVLARKLELE